MSDLSGTVISNPQEQRPVIAGKTIFIAGAGIGGLAFATALSKQWPSTFPKPKLTIFERDNYEDRVGREGYTLSLRTDSRSGGVQALDKLGLYEKVHNASFQGGGENAGSMFIWDKNWNELLNIRSEPVGDKGLKSMRIRRNALQRALADAAVESGTDIRWGTAVVDAKRDKNSKMTISLSNGTIVSCDMLIAADGSRSNLRTRLRPSDKLDFAGVICISGTAKFENEKSVPKPLDRDWGALLGGQGIGLFVAPVDSESALWSLSYYAQQPREQLHYPMSEKDVEALLEESRSLGKHFTPKVNSLVNATDPSTLMVFNAMDRPPFSHSLAKDGAVVWIGDANHAVSPFAGNGANMALMDGWDLAQCLCQATSPEAGLAMYDKMFVPRTQATLNMSRWSISIAHSTGVKLWLYTMFAKVLGVLISKRNV